MVFSPHKEILPASQQELWPKLKVAADRGFVLYGGTAIALRLGHRVSVDFDLFSDRVFVKEEIWEAFPFLSAATVLHDRTNTLTVLAPSLDGVVKISFFGGLTFGRVGEPEYTDDQIMQIASLEDLIATKMKTILQRVEAKDYMDVAGMIRAGLRLEDALGAATIMYGTSFQPSECLKAMTYFEGGDLASLSTGDRKTLVRAAASVGEIAGATIRARSLAISPGQTDRV